MTEDGRDMDAYVSGSNMPLTFLIGLYCYVYMLRLQLRDRLSADF